MKNACHLIEVYKNKLTLPEITGISNRSFAQQKLESIKKRDF